MKTLEELIKHYESYSEKPYKDTVGKLTIAYGRNLDDRGISPDEAELMLDNDILMCKTEMSPYTWYYGKPPHVRDALVRMCYNLGLTRLLKFKKMLAALEVGDYNTAAIEALDSKWAGQVGCRAIDIACMIRGANEP